jgi:ABC-type multidrug transport system ATPase subunit
MIKVINLTKRFGDFIAVDDVSFSVRDGETLALLGPNGSGKSTILKCIAGLVIPSSGEVVIGTSASANGLIGRRMLSYLPQRIDFHRCLTAGEVLEFYCRLRQMPLSRIDDVLHRSEFDFNGFSKKRVSELSGGMIQRLGLAVACLADAPILLLDEPTVSLDPKGTITFRRFLKQLKSQGRTIIFTSHMLADVAELADRVAILVNGKLAAIESVGNLRSDLELGGQTIEEVYLRYAESV